MKKVISVLVIMLMVTSIFMMTFVSADPIENGAEDVVAGDVVNEGFEVESGDGEVGIVGISADLEGAELDDVNGENSDDEDERPAGCLGLGGMEDMVIMILVFGGGMWFIMIRPQKKRQKEQQNLLAGIKVSDEVVSIGGIHGKVVRIKDDTFLLETGIGTQKSFVHIERAAISRIEKEGSGKHADATPTFDEDGPEYVDGDA